MKTLWGFKIYNQERLKDWETCIVAANHISANDPPFIGSSLPVKINIIAKSELFRMPVLGKIITALEAIPIKRGLIDRKAILSISSRLAKGQSVLIFPEGSRKRFTAKPGIGKIALETKTSILPVYIKNSNNFLKCLFRIKRLEIVIGERIEIEPFLKEDIGKEDYRNLADYILERINSLRNDH